MKIYACMVVKNEEDIVAKTINSALKWADKIFVMDNNSSDNTVAEINKISNDNENVIFWGVYGGKFRDSIRSIIYSDYSYMCSEGDWWCRLDADEIYIDNPREFLSNCDSHVDHIYSASFQYYYTKEMAAREKEDVEYIKIPFENRLKYFKCDWSEIRFVKIKNNTIWPLNFSNPFFLVNPDKRRIKLRHYQYRSVEQMVARLASRRPESGKSLFSHELRKNKLWDQSELVLDNGVYQYIESELPVMKKANIVKKIGVIILNYVTRVKIINRLLMASKEVV